MLGRPAEPPRAAGRLPPLGLATFTDFEAMDGLFFNELADLLPADDANPCPEPPHEPPAAAANHDVARAPPAPAPPAPPPMQQAAAVARAPAAPHHPAGPAALLQQIALEAREAAAGRAPAAGGDESLSETRRARNRDHARRSRCRKKLVVESLQESLVAFQQENERLRNAVRKGLGPSAAAALAKCAAPAGGGDALLTAQRCGTDGVDCRVIDKYDYGLLAALRSANRSFVITDPTLPDNPIIFASGGFLELTGYDLGQILGRNCRFLQGPRTNAQAVEKIRKGISEGNDVQVCLLNYKVDSTTFWNHFFIAPLRDDRGVVVNFLGVQTEVSERVAMAILQNEADGSKSLDESENMMPPKRGKIALS
ncbi:hypothetical protein M885DRAFT_514569 [Pelagophyceae sp. CCMP2097]|nr:hypothetical protein M885DRAFT_514569 [Pelagophyceae sp. CCMP2097]